MSFLKITDPKKRDLMVKEFLETKKNIQQSQLHERVGEREFQEDLGKLFKPVTDAQKRSAEEIKEELKPLKEIAPAIAAIPGPPHAPLPLPDLEDDTIRLGPIAAHYIGNPNTDTTFGIRVENGKLYMGNKPIKIEGDDIFVDGTKYKGTERLWELIMDKYPDDEVLDDDADYENYAKLLFDTNAIFRNNDPNNLPKASGGYKWIEIVKPIWEVMTGKIGSGLSDPNALLERLDLLMESKKAGNTGVGRELVSICDELERQNVLNKKQYKKIVSNV